MFGTIFTIALLVLFGSMLVALFTRSLKPVTAVKTKPVDTTKAQLTDGQIRGLISVLLQKQTSAPNGLTVRAIHRRLVRLGHSVSRVDVGYALMDVTPTISRRGRKLYQGC